MKNRKQAVEELFGELRSLRRSMAMQSAGSVKSPRITPSQWGALMHIEHAGKSTVKDVSRALGVTSSAATQLVDGLVASGYLTRQHSLEDRRTVTLALSKKSKSRIEQMKREALQKFLKVFEVLNDKEFGAYLALTKKLVEASRKSQKKLTV